MKRTTFLLLGIFTLAITANATIRKSSVARLPFGQVKAKDLTLKTEKPTKHFVKIALLLDTSNSMDGLIDQAKSQLWDIVNEFSYVRCGNETRPELRIALYEYGNDGLSSKEGYIRQVLGFSNDLDKISEKLFSLATNGGEEFCGQAINTSLKQLEWGKDKDDLKLIFIAGNEPFDQGRLHYKDATSQAMEKDVVVNTIFCGAYAQGVHTKWKEGAQRTGGEYTAIDHNKAIVHIDTPYDDVIIRLNGKLNKTYVSYGYLGRERIAAQQKQDEAAEELDEEVVVKRAVSKSSRLYNNANWDLVDATKDAEFDLDKVDKKLLPKELQGKSKGEIKTYVDQKQKERNEITAKIQELQRKRLAYIKSKTPDKKGTLEDALLKALRKQAAHKNYSWDKEAR